MTRRPGAARPSRMLSIDSRDVTDVCDLIDWAIDAAAYDKKMARELLANAKKLLKAAATPT